MDMGGTSTQTEITIQECGKMGNAQAGVNWLIRVERFTKECGSIVSLQETERNLTIKLRIDKMKVFK